MSERERQSNIDASAVTEGVRRWESQKSIAGFVGFGVLVLSFAVWVMWHWIPAALLFMIGIAFASGIYNMKHENTPPSA